MLIYPAGSKVPLRTIIRSYIIYRGLTIPISKPNEGEKMTNSSRSQSRQMLENHLHKRIFLQKTFLQFYLSLSALMAGENSWNEIKFLKGHLWIIVHQIIVKSNTIVLHLFSLIEMNIYIVIYLSSATWGVWSTVICSPPTRIQPWDDWLGRMTNSETKKINRKSWLFINPNQRSWCQIHTQTSTLKHLRE